MFVKILALFMILGVCLAFPAEDIRHPVPVPVGVTPPNAKGPQPPKSDDSDLKTDPSTWWHTSWYQTYPVYYYNVPGSPTYTYWQTHY